mgnify:CR=1 FL=1
MQHTSLEAFYKEASIFTGREIETLLPPRINKEIGHFNVFDISETIRTVKEKNQMPYNRRAYYKISLIRGKNRAEYADKVIEVSSNALLFATPNVPYHWVPLDENQKGSFCVFTDAFLTTSKSDIDLNKLPIFQPGSFPIFEISDEQAEAITPIFNKMKTEIDSDYEFKYDLLRTYLLELIHHGQKLSPAHQISHNQNASKRIISLFIELLERQFPIESSQQRLQLRSAKDFADRLSIHVNHLNKVLKENTGSTTTTVIGQRIIQEAKILLKQTDWSVSEIAFSLGFEEVAHFSNFFKKQTQLSPLNFRA